MHKKIKRKLKDIFLRYSILVIFSFFALPVFYFIFRPLTVYPGYFLFKIFYEVILINQETIILPSMNLSLEIIGACIAGSAYFLFTLLNLTTPDIKLKKRLALLGISFLLFLIINILRIFIVGVLYAENIFFADFAHKLFWYAGSILFVILIWFWEVRKFKIKEIPFYSDVKFFIRHIKGN